MPSQTLTPSRLQETLVRILSHVLSLDASIPYTSVESQHYSKYPSPDMSYQMAIWAIIADMLSVLHRPSSLLLLRYWLQVTYDTTCQLVKGWVGELRVAEYDRKYSEHEASKGICFLDPEIRPVGRWIRFWYTGLYIMHEIQADRAWSPAFNAAWALGFFSNPSSWAILITSLLTLLLMPLYAHWICGQKGIADYLFPSFMT